MTIISAAQSWLEELRAHVIPDAEDCEREGYEMFAVELEAGLGKLG